MMEPPKILNKQWAQPTLKAKPLKTKPLNHYLTHFAPTISARSTTRWL